MRIQHNIMAMNAYNQYNKNTKSLSGNLEKLSSGYKINRAGDDAAGLAISEKMRAQITGLDAAQKNVKDGISLVKTAEGAMQEIHDMLNKMTYLATQSANGTYQDEVDRENLQKEVNSLRSEIDRIADAANFNGIKLLDGSLDTSTNVTQEPIINGATTWAMAATNAANTQGTHTILHKDGKDSKGTTFDVVLSNVAFAKSAATPAAQTVTLTVNGVGITAGVTANSDTLEAEDIAALFNGKTAVIGGMTYDIKADGGKLSFSMQTANIDAITTAASFDGNFDVLVGISGTDFTAVGDTSFATSNVVAGNGKEATQLADTAVTTAVVAADFKDGAGVKIGNESYVFALKKETLDKFKDATGVKVVDLTDLAKSDGSALDTTKNPNALRDAVDRLTVAAKDNDMFVVEHSSNGGDGKMTFREQVDYYEKNADHVDLSDETVLRAQFQKFESVTLPEPDPNAAQALTLQIGETADDYNQMSVSIGDMHVSAMGTKDGMKVSDIDISTQSGAQAAVQVIKDAINYVSSIRGDLGAIQNRLDHTGNNLAVMQENIQDAESTIRDTDVAEEMMKYVKNNILVQSSQAMLAQANQVPQGVLQLLG